MIRKCLCLPAFCLAGAACFAFSACKTGSEIEQEASDFVLDELDRTEYDSSTYYDYAAEGALDIRILSLRGLKPGTWFGNSVNLTTTGEMTRIFGGNSVNNGKIKVMHGLYVRIDEVNNEVIFESVLFYKFHKIPEDLASLLVHLAIIGNPDKGIYNRHTNSITAQSAEHSYLSSDLMGNKCVYTNKTGDAMLVKFPPPLDSIYKDVVMRWTGN